jgi:DNA-binding transcriptional LysR family regulator
MQIELIETFLDLVESRSFHRTAEKLGVTQSTVSARVQALETALEVRLFLRHEWHQAKRRILLPQRAAHLVRIGIQNDLSALYLGDWVAGFRRALPDTAFYIEPDYSNQMCVDVLTGTLDFAVMFSPKPHPDLHFESVGEVTYAMISTETDRMEGVRPESFVFGHFSPAFEEMHRQLMPDLAGSLVSVGQSGSVVSLLMASGGAGYVLEKTAADLVAQGRFRRVADAPALRQPVYAAMHLRDRITPLHRKLTRIVAREISGRS